MLSNIRTADVIKAINYFVMRNEVTFRSSGPLVLSSAHAPAGTENRSNYQLLRCVALRFSTTGVVKLVLSDPQGVTEAFQGVHDR